MNRIILICLLFAAASSFAATVIDTISARIDSSLLTASINKANDSTWLANQLKDGTWPDIDYTSKGVSNWPPVQHPQRLAAIALAWAKIGSPWYHVDSVLVHIQRGFDGYLTKNPVSANWWFNQIGAAEPWGQALVLVNGAFPLDTMTRWAQYINGNWSTWTGANLTDEGTAHIYRCIATKQASGIDSVITAFRAAVKLVDAGDGIHRDYSFSFHAGLHLIYNGGYGATFLGEELNWWQLVTGTSFAFPAAQTNLLESMLLDGSAWMAHNGRWDPSVIGRDIARTGIHGAGLTGNAKTLLATNNRTAELNALSNWSYAKGPWPWPSAPDRFFWTCQYLTHHGPGWMVAVRGVRTGVTGAEAINGENLKGWFLPFGATWIHVRGDEHDQIWPSLDWSRIPGVTVDRVDTFPASPNNKGWGSNTGNTAFVGAASDGQGAAFAYDYSVSSITAKKAWFQTPDAMVALGAGLAFNKPRTVNTSVDQRLARGTVTLGAASGTTTTLSTDSLRTGTLRWIQHDSVGYWFPVPETLMVASHNQSGSWKDIDTEYASTPVVQKVFSTWIDHGKTLSSGSYIYAVVPGVSADSMAKWVKAAPVHIAANDTNAQAVSEGTWHGVVFHEANKKADSVSFSDGLSIKANVPCALVLRDSAAGVVLTASDPGQTSVSVNLVLSKGSFSKALTVTFPVAPLAGSSVHQWIAIPVSSSSSSVALSSSSIAQSSSSSKPSSSSIAQSSSSTKPSSSSIAQSSSAAKSSSSVTSSSSLLPTSSSANSSSSVNATTTIHFNPEILANTQAQVFDLLGHAYSSWDGVSALPHGTWILVHTTIQGKIAEIRRVP